MTPGEAAAWKAAEKLISGKKFEKKDFLALMGELPQETEQALFRAARECSVGRFGRKIYLRGLIEISNICKNNCYYCGIRRGNREAERYRLTREEILACCENGYRMGFRTFVLQGGEDPAQDDAWVEETVAAIREKYSGCAVTLSLGEKSRDSYRRFREAGADRYLLRHETADPEHYRRLHPEEMSLENRLRCLRDLKELGYQTGTGMMVGSPYQTLDTLWEDMQFIAELRPEMIGIGPYLVHHGTPFADRENGSMARTLRLLAIFRLLYPDVLLPATTALATIHPEGRTLGILAGANVVMPNLGPAGSREKYELYDYKLCTGQEAAESKKELEKMMGQIGYTLSESRGDFQEHSPRCRQVE